MIEEYHTCHFCGTYVLNGYEHDGTRHYLSDCRPDLVKHEPGDVCTWAGLRDATANCYAFQDLLTRQWGDEHIHFFKDGPM
jgi:hypothetical protein